MYRSQSSSNAKGTLNWMAPECFGDKTVASFPADIWSFGCLLIEVFTGLVPFHELQFPQIAAHLSPSGKKTAPPELELNSTFQKKYPFWYDLASSCFHEDPSKRPTAEELVVEIRKHARHGAGMVVGGGVSRAVEDLKSILSNLNLTEFAEILRKEGAESAQDVLMLSDNELVELGVPRIKARNLLAACRKR